MECTGSFAVEPKVLGKGLRDAEFEALLDKVAHRPSVVFEVAGCETLVCAIEEGEMLLRSYDFGEFDPLLTGEIYACGVVCAGVQEEDASFWGRFNGGAHAGEVKHFGFGREVGVCFYGELDVCKYLVVVGPGWGGEVDGLIGRARIEL